MNKEYKSSDGKETLDARQNELKTYILGIFFFTFYVDDFSNNLAFNFLGFFSSNELTLHPISDTTSMFIALIF